MSKSFDVAIVGAGLIGASAAYHLSKNSKTVLIEQEAYPGYHASGRSAAVLLPPYGGPLARGLTAASIGFLMQPPNGFSEVPLVTPRGALFIAGAQQTALLDKWLMPSSGARISHRLLSAAEVASRVPILKTDQIARAVTRSDVWDIDAAALLQGYIRTFRGNGGTLLVNAPVRAIDRSDGVWVIDMPGGAVRAKLLLNAAGAWADQIAELAGVSRKGLTPTRRTMVVLNVPAIYDIRSWPLVSDAAETFYFKPDVGRLLVSPADCTPVSPQDIQPDAWDVAVAVDRIEKATTLQIRGVAHQWAGLRTMSPDDEPIIGRDTEVTSFFWAAGFGGFGVQASYAAGLCCELLLHGVPSLADLSALGLSLDRLSPSRISL